MNAEIISVGTELLLGHTVNTDTSFVARELSAAGIGLLYSCTVGDNPERLKEAVETALQRSDILIATGGLGPTGDDLTKETVAACAGKKLVMDESSMRHIEKYFEGRALGETQKKQAMLPEGCTVLPNDIGTAPGCGFRAKNDTLVVMLPGPPSELVPMLKNYAIPFLLKAAGNAAIVSRNVHVFGLGEGYVAEKIDDLCAGKIRPAPPMQKTAKCLSRVTARAESRKKPLQCANRLWQSLKKRLGNFCYGTDVESLEEAVVRLLTEKHQTVATAESCTGGLVAKRITDIPGSSDVFHMGVVTYSNDIKTKLLGVPEEMLEKYSAVSPQVAKRMARAYRNASAQTTVLALRGWQAPAAEHRKSR